MTYQQIDSFIRARDDALERGTVEDLERFFGLYWSFFDERLLLTFRKSPRANKEVTLRKMQANSMGVSPKTRKAARAWLEERGFSTKL